MRLSHSHIRIGSFQRFLALGEPYNIERLLDHTIRTYMPALWRDNPADRAEAFLAEVLVRVAQLGAQWMTAGFVHGVLNTDNINVTGESFDYGPWRFAPTNDAGFTAAYFDQFGLYAFGRQPEALYWNLNRLGECLVPLAGHERIVAVLQDYGARLQASFTDAVLARLGLEMEEGEAGQDRADALVAVFWRFLAASGAPFEQTFFDWYGGHASTARAERSPSAALYASEGFAPVREAMKGVSARPEIRLDHSYFAALTPCTMLIEEVEALWEPIARADDWSAVETKLAVIESMAEAYGTLPLPAGA